MTQDAHDSPRVPYPTLPSPQPERVRAMTEREYEVLVWIARGKSNQSIATILGISPHTVDTLCRRIFERLNVASRTTAAVRAAQMELLPWI